MSKIFESENHELFETFLIKEKEQREIEKIHAQETIKYMGRCFEEEESKATFLTKIKWFFYDLIDSYKLRKIKNKNETIVNAYSKEELCNACLKEKVLDRKDFKIHIVLNRIFETRNTIADCGGISYPYLCYQVYIQIEFCELLTEKYYFEEYQNIDKAAKYYEDLINSLKNKKIQELITTLDKNIDNHCKELKDRIKFFKDN